MKYENFNWFYAATIDGPGAEKLLRQVAKDGCFLVRISGTKRYYVLTLYSAAPRPRLWHYHIYQNTGGRFYFEGSKDNYYPTLQALIEHHVKCKHDLPCLLKCTPKGSLVAGISFTGPKRLLTPNTQRNVQKPPTPRKPGPGCITANGKCVCKWQIDIDELELLAKLGQGSFGVVHKARLRSTALVAVKMLLPGAMSEELFIKEAHVMTELKHPNIVRLCGICTNQKPIFIVTEFMSHGSLLAYLRRKWQMLLASPTALRSICAQVSFGMMYLEEQRFVHRDLACRNCLVNDEGAVKVADFGMSKFMANSSYQANAASLFPIYSVPPEVISKRMFSSKSDVWAFGLLMWEVFTGGMAPYWQYKRHEVMDAVESGRIMAKPKDASNWDYDIMTRCWAYTPDKRPTFARINALFRKQLGY